MEEDYYGEEDSVDFAKFRERAVEELDNMEFWEEEFLNGIEDDWQTTMVRGADSLEEEEEE